MGADRTGFRSGFTDVDVTAVAAFPAEGSNFDENFAFFDVKIAIEFVLNYQNFAKISQNKKILLKIFCQNYLSNCKRDIIL